MLVRTLQCLIVLLFMACAHQVSQGEQEANFERNIAADLARVTGEYWYKEFTMVDSVYIKDDKSLEIVLSENEIIKKEGECHIPLKSDKKSTVITLFLSANDNHEEKYQLTGVSFKGYRGRNLASLKTRIAEVRELEVVSLDKDNQEITGEFTASMTHPKSHATGRFHATFCSKGITRH